MSILQLFLVILKYSATALAGVAQSVGVSPCTLKGCGFDFHSVRAHA